jgi:hypothetical protein
VKPEIHFRVNKRDMTRSFINCIFHPIDQTQIGHIALPGEARNAYKFLKRKSEDKSLDEVSDIKMNLNEMYNKFGTLITWAATYHVAMTNVLNRICLYFGIYEEKIQKH